MKSLSLILSVYNEDQLVDSAVNRCVSALEADKIDYEIILVDDGSYDATFQVASSLSEKNPRIKVLQNHVNLNFGISIQRAMMIAKKDYVLYNGIDLPFNPKWVKSFLDKMNGLDVMVLQKDTYAGASIWRRFCSSINNIIRTLAFPRLSKDIWDMSYVQFYRREIIKKLVPLAKSPAFTAAEMILRARLGGLKIAVHDAKLDLRESGKGAFGKPHDILWTLYDIFRFRIRVWMKKL